MNPLEQLRKRYADLLAEARQLNDKAGAEGRDFTTEEQTRWDAIATEKETLTRKIQREEQLQAEERANKQYVTPPLTESRRVEVGRTLVEDDPMRGYRSTREFFKEVIDVGTGRRRAPERLQSLRAPDSAPEQRAAGSDEQGGYADVYGGFLVPVGMLPNLLQVNPEADPVAGKTQNVPMAAPRVEINARVDKNHSTSVSGGLTVTRRNETGGITSSRMGFEKVTLNAYSLFGLTFATEEILTDSAISFAAIIDRGFRDEFPSVIMKERINGTGVGEFLGVLNSPALVTIDKKLGQTADTIVWENIRDMRARTWGYSNAIWTYNPDCLPQLMELTMPIGTAGIPLWIASARDGEPDRLLGRPAIPSDYCKTVGDLGDLICCNWSEYLEGVYQPLQSAESMHVRFENHERTFKFWMRNAGAPWWKSALTPVESSVTRSPFVALAARA